MQLATSVPAPGSCLGNFSWNASTIGGGESAFSGILAGFVFAGIVAVLGVGVTERRQDAASALKLLFCAFLGLLVAAYLLVAQSADQNCLRTVSEGTVFGGILGTFVIIMLVALTWLVAAYDKREDGVLQFLRQLIYVGTGLVVLLLCTSSYSYLRAAVPHGPSLTVVVFIYVVGAAFYVAGLPRVAGRHYQATSRAADVCAWAALCYLGVAAISGSIVLGTTDSAWDPRPLHAIYIIAWASLIAPLAVLVSALHACAPDRTARKHSE